MIGEIFKAYDIRSTYPDKVNATAAWRVGYATGQFIARQTLDPSVKQPNTVLVSRDMRPHSPELAAALIEGLRAAGRDVIDLGMCDTSFMYFAVNHLAAAGGVQTTASHNPVNYNGFKLSGQLAKPIGSTTGLNDIRTIAEKLEADGVGPDGAKATGQLAAQDLWPAYRKHVLSFLGPLKRKVSVFIDACNGMGGRLVPGVFDDVANLDIHPLNFEITGSFAHDPNPLVPENMVPTQKGVRKHGADLGVCFDGDADRCIITDEQGQIIGCDHLTALLAEHFLAREPGKAVIYDLRSSKVVEEVIRSHGGEPRMCRVGHVFMKALLREIDGIFGGELSGHFYFRGNFYADSGAITFAALLSVLGQSDKTLSELIAPYRKYPQSGEINFRNDDKDGALATLKRKYAGDATITELDGVTVDAFDTLGWWFNVRASNTEPLLRLNAEAKDAGVLKQLLGEIKPLLGEEAKGH